MLHTPASTQAAFFRQYDFRVDSRASLYTEFIRLADTRKWKEGSKSKKFEQAWCKCFGSDIPVGHDIDKRASRVGAQQSGDGGEFSSLLYSLQNLDLQKRTTKKVIRHKEVEPEFSIIYGTNASVKAKWQALCRDCGVDPLPPSINKCKKVQYLPALCSARIAAEVSFYQLGT